MAALDNLGKLKLLISPYEISDAEGELLLEVAGNVILNRMYPYGIPASAVVPERYELTQVRIAEELFSKKGVSGQTAHSENGINRSYESGTISESLLRDIVPMGAVVV